MYFREWRAVEERPEILDNFVGTRNFKTNMNKQKWKNGEKTYFETE